MLVMDTVPVAQLFAWKAWLTENNEWCPADRATTGYIRQEIKKLMNGAHE
jgi:hypothetical protein